MCAIISWATYDHQSIKDAIKEVQYCMPRLGDMCCLNQAPHAGGIKRIRNILFFCLGLVTKIVLIARVTLGDPFYAKKENNKNHNQRRRPPDRETQQGLLYDSMVANATSGQVHREIMVYDRSQAYPE